MTSPVIVGGLQRSADQQVESLRSWLEEEAEAGRTVLAYGAASRAVALFSRAGISYREVSARFSEFDGRWTVDGRWLVRLVAPTERSAGIC
jgi:hypothetical protein